MVEVDSQRATRGVRPALVVSLNLPILALALIMASASPSGGADGDLDKTFSGDGRAAFEVPAIRSEKIAMALQPDGKILLLTSVQIESDSGVGYTVLRLLPDGSLDESFATDGRLRVGQSNSDDSMSSIAVDPADGGILVAGTRGGSTDGEILVARFERDGEVDRTFGGGDGEVTSDLGGDDVGRAIALQPDRKIVVAGSRVRDGATRAAVVRYTASGAPDPDFSSDGELVFDFGGDDIASSLALQPDGKIIVGATRTTNDAGSVFAVARLLPNGNFDETFSGNGKVFSDFGGDSIASCVAVEPDGKILAAGTRISTNGRDFAVARYTSAGSPDPDFGGTGKRTTDFGFDETAHAITIQPDGRIVVAGTRENSSGIDFALARFDSNGALDLTFSGNGKLTTDFAGGSDFGQAIAVQSDGNLVAAGIRSAAAGSFLAAARYVSSSRLSAGALEAPARSSTQSGLGLISGWVCDARVVAIRLDDGPPLETAYGTDRADTLAVCGDLNNGFGLLLNWGILEPGDHLVRVFADGALITSASFRTTRLGAAFLRGAEGEYTLPRFPTADESVKIRWQEAQQKFVLIEVGVALASHAPPAREQAGVIGVLENPTSGSTQSGVSVISGWVCDASQVLIQLDDRAPVVAGYKTTRNDTVGACGDSDNGFGLLLNWGNLGPGIHTVRALADGMEFGSSSFSVVTLGAPFVTGLTGRYTLAGFPSPSQSVTVEWSEGQQSFVIVELLP